MLTVPVYIYVCMYRKEYHQVPGKLSNISTELRGIYQSRVGISVQHTGRSIQDNINLYSIRAGFTVIKREHWNYRISYFVLLITLKNYLKLQLVPLSKTYRKRCFQPFLKIISTILTMIWNKMFVYSKYFRLFEYFVQFLTLYPYCNIFELDLIIIFFLDL